MTKTGIIGHRGAAGIALENTLPAFKEAVALGVPRIEFDVHLTKDNKFVVCHDDNLKRVSESTARIKDLDYAKLRLIPLYNGATVPLLTEVLDLARKSQTAVIIEMKAYDHLEALCQLLDSYSDLNITIASFNHKAMHELRVLRPHYIIYLAEGHHPIEVVQTARAHGMQGIDLNYMLMNPLTYFLARRWKLDIMLYSVSNPFMIQLDHPWIIRLVTFLYPGVHICTNHPERFKHLYHPKKSKSLRQKLRS
jgi:glycerophosphoryl diester phosphodiesterase